MLPSRNAESNLHTNQGGRVQTVLAGINHKQTNKEAEYEGCSITHIWGCLMLVWLRQHILPGEISQSFYSLRVRAVTFQSV
jgi:hypothetical protein